MEHNRRKYIINRPYNTFAKTKWNVLPVSSSRNSQAFMQWDPNASWNQRQPISPIKWGPTQNWNTTRTVGDIMHENDSRFYDKTLSLSAPSENDIHATEGGNKRKCKHSIKRRRSRKSRKSRKLRKSRNH